MKNIARLLFLCSATLLSQISFAASKFSDAFLLDDQRDQTKEVLTSICYRLAYEEIMVIRSEGGWLGFYMPSESASFVVSPNLSFAFYDKGANHSDSDQFIDQASFDVPSIVNALRPLEEAHFPDLAKVGPLPAQWIEYSASDIPFCNNLPRIVVTDYEVEIEGISIYSKLFIQEGNNDADVAVYYHGGPAAHVSYPDPFILGILDAGFSVLAVNYRGSTGYGPDYMRLGHGEQYLKMYEDGLLSYREIFGEPYPSMLIGHSWGGFLLFSQLHANNIPDSTPVMTVNAPCDIFGRGEGWLKRVSNYLKFKYYFKYLIISDPNLKAAHTLNYALGDNSSILSSGYFCTPREFNKNLLIVHATDDPVITLDKNVSRIGELVEIESNNHFISAAQLTVLISDWELLH